MSRLSALDPDSIAFAAKTLLEQVQREIGMVPAILRVIANSPAALEGFLAMQECLDNGALDKRLRVQIALAVSQANDSEYCIAAHTAIGRAAGLSDEALRDARRATSPDSRTDAALKFARALGARPALPLDKHLDRLRDAGYESTHVAEMIAHTVLVSMTNCFFHASAVNLDFPRVELSEVSDPAD